MLRVLVRWIAAVSGALILVSCSTAKKSQVLRQSQALRHRTYADCGRECAEAGYHDSGECCY